MRSIEMKSGLKLSYLGPDVAQGPLPAVFYFALSALESLNQDPFNQPAAYLSSLPLRIFSIDLPGHGSGLPATQALSMWAEEFAHGHNIIGTCIEEVKEAVEMLIKQEIARSHQMAVMGLSRGAFIATHVAAQIPHFHTVLGFAPLTQITHAKEFQDLSSHPLIESLNLKHLIEKLTHRTLRFYIGNLDKRVGTRHCFEFIEKLADAALKHKIRSPQVELIITPSIGHQGHGTSKEVFHQGAQWIAEKLGMIDVA
jgi:pimeloyl-ACP methyl ester carboxylesterase